jgi:hypothetical protein
MISSRAIIISSSILSSVYLFTTSLKEFNKYFLYNEIDNNKYYYNILNGFTLLLSTSLLSYCCVKTIDYRD